LCSELVSEYGLGYVKHVETIKKKFVELASHFLAKDGFDSLEDYDSCNDYGLRCWFPKLKNVILVLDQTLPSSYYKMYYRWRAGLAHVS
jgi:hypothetical protein